MIWGVCVFFFIAGVCVIWIARDQRKTQIRRCQQQRYRYRVILKTSKSVSENNVSETSNLIVLTHENRLRPCVRCCKIQWYNFQVHGCFWLNANQTISMALILTAWNLFLVPLIIIVVVDSINMRRVVSCTGKKTLTKCVAVKRIKTVIAWIKKTLFLKTATQLVLRSSMFYLLLK